MRPDHDVGKDKGSNSGEYRRIQEIRDLIRASIGEGSGPVLGKGRIRARCQKNVESGRVPRKG